MKSIIVIGVLSLIASNAQAQGIFDKNFFVDAVSRKKIAVTKTTKAQPACTDFSGTWTGQCTYNGANAAESNVTLQQIECEGIAWQGIAVPINGIVTIQNLPSQAAKSLLGAAIQFQTNWNETKTEVSGKVRVSTPDSGLTDLATVTMNMKMNGENMEMSQKIQSEGQSDTNINCSYHHP